MSKKSIISLILMLLLLVVAGVFAVKYIWNDNEDVGVIVTPTPTLPPINTAAPTPATPTPTILPTTTPTPGPEKEFTYYWKPQYNFEENDYVDSDDMINIQNNADTLGMVPEKYYVTESSNIKMVRDVGYDELQLISVTGDYITIGEEDPTETTIQKLRTSYLESIGFRAYLAADPVGIPADSKFSETEGLENWFQYVENKDMPSRVDIVDETLFLVTDDVIRTSYGNAMWIVTYNKWTDTYDAIAYITNDTGMRIIRVVMVNIEDYGRCSSYLYEITDEVIHLIK